MTPLRLTTWFKKRMLPLVVATAIPVAAAAPIAFWLQKRAELRQTARTDAARVADVVRQEIEQHPRLWRYDATKLGELFAAEGLDRRPMRVFSGGREVAIDFFHAQDEPAVPLWGRADVSVGEQRATIWVAVDAAALRNGTLVLSLMFALLAAGLGSVLYLLPVRAIASAERRTHLLLGRLALTLQEADRRRIARDLHDGAGQALTAARLELMALAARSGEKEAVQRIGKQLDEALAEVRRSSVALGPPALQELGFARAVERHCEAFADSAHLRVTCEIDELPAVGPDAELAGYRIVQEALTNVARHANATQAWVRIAAREGSLRITVADDGRGLPGGAEGSGLRGMRERAQLLGGDLRLEKAAMGGLQLAVHMPLEGA